jgi:hypothetical protein
VNVNLTLVVDEDVLERARDVASQQGTSVNALIRDFLDQLAGARRGETLAQELREAWKKPRGDSRGWRWSRGDLYADRIGRSR